jgi:hypothetical protein
MEAKELLDEISKDDAGFSWCQQWVSKIKVGLTKIEKSYLDNPNFNSFKLAVLSQVEMKKLKAKLGEAQ